MSERFEHIVIGGGISGLGLAYYAARRGVPTLVLEAQGRVGGCLHSPTFPGCGDFWVEAGGHTGFNSYGHLLDILGDLGMMPRLTPKAKVSYALWRGGQRHRILSALHPLELLLSLPRLFSARARKASLSVRDYYGPGLGAKNYRDLFGPAFSAVICQPADEYPADLLFRRKPRRKEVLRAFTLPGGLGEIPLALARQPGVEVRTGQDLVGVHWDGKDFRLLLADGGELRAGGPSRGAPGARRRRWGRGPPPWPWDTSRPPPGSLPWTMPSTPWWRGTIWPIPPIVVSASTSGLAPWTPRARWTAPAPPWESSRIRSPVSSRSTIVCRPYASAMAVGWRAWMPPWPVPGWPSPATGSRVSPSRIA